MKQYLPLLLLPLFAHAQPLPEHWQRHTQNGFTTYTPQDSARTFMIIALEPMPLYNDTLEAWGERAADTLSASYGQIRERLPAQSENGHWRSTHRLTGNSGTALLANYIAHPLPGQQARMIVMLAEEHLPTIQTHSSASSDLIAALLAQGQTAPSSTPTASNADTAIHAILHHSETTYGVYGLQVIEHEHVLYQDGRLESDGKAAGRWQQQNGVFTDAQGQALAGEAVTPLSAQRLVGHYRGDRGGAFGSAVSYVQSNRFTFHANGRYEHDGGFSGMASGVGSSDGSAVATSGSATLVSGAGGSSATAKSQRLSSGSWRIIGEHLIELQDDNGTTQHVIAYFTSDNWLTLDRHAYKKE